MESNPDPITAWVRHSAAHPTQPEPPVPRPLRLRRKLAAAVREGVAEAAAMLYPDTPQAREHLAALLLENDSQTWPLVDGTDPLHLVQAVRAWLSIADPDTYRGTDPDPPGDELGGDAPPPDRVDHPLLVPLCVAIIEAIRKQAVHNGDEALLELWLDFEEAADIDTTRLPAIPLLPDDEDDGATPTDPVLGELQDVYSRRRLPSLAPWVIVLAAIGVVADFTKLTGSGGPGWVSAALLLVVAVFFLGRIWAGGGPRPGSSDVESLEVYEHGVIANTVDGKEVTIRPVRLWASNGGTVDQRTRGLKLVWSPDEHSEPVFTDLDSFASSRWLKQSLLQGDFVQAEPPAMES